MIEQMTKYSFILLSGDQASFLDQLQELGMVDITRSAQPIDEDSAAILTRTEEIAQAISKLNNFDLSKDPDKDKISGVCNLSTKDPVKETFTALNRLAELKTALAAAQNEQEARKVWGEYDPQALKGLIELGYHVRFYSTGKKHFDPAWGEMTALQVISEDSDKVWFVTISNDHEYNFPISDMAFPSGTVQDSEKEIKTITDKIISCKGELQALKGCVEDMAREKEEKLHELDMYLANASCETASENYISIFEGFAPTSEDARLCATFDKMDLYYLKDAAKVEDDPPIELKGNWFTRAFHSLTDMYGRPVYNEFDPTPFMSIFFLLFFAMCMGDAGYGIVLIFIGLALKGVKSMASMAPLVTILGVGTTLVGIVMHTFFGVDLAQLAWIPDWLKAVMITEPIAGFDAQMVIALIVGIIHLCLAMIVKTVYATKNQGFLNSLGTWGWTTLIVGGVVLAGLAIFQLVPMEILKWIIIGLGAVSAIGIFLLNDIHRNPLINIGSGLWDTYNTATGLLGDVLSYLRLYALGLAGGMLGQAFNQIAIMTLGDAGFSWGFQLIPFVLICLVGHTLNLAMCCLGAFVHPLRLNFLEFFKNSGYEGKGRKYKPISK